MGAMVIRWVIMSVIILAAVFIVNDFRGIPIPVLLMVIVVLIFTFISQKTTSCMQSAEILRMRDMLELM